MDIYTLTVWRNQNGDFGNNMKSSKVTMGT